MRKNVLLVLILTLLLYIFPKSPVTAENDNYFPLEIGNKWTFEITSNGRKVIMDYVAVSKSIVDDKETVMVESRVNNLSQKKEYYETNTDGVFTVTRQIGIYNFKFDPKQPFLKYPVNIGDSWTQNGSFTDEANNLTFVYQLKCKYKSKVKVKTPAGTFKSIKVSLRMDCSDGSRIEGYRYFCPGIGLIKEDFKMFDNKKNKTSMISVLKSYEIGSTKATSTQSDLFEELNEEVKLNPYGIENKKKALIFEKIYNQNKNSPGFKQSLLSFLAKDTEKYYWIGIYLYDSYYTQISNPDWALEILNKGLEICNQDSDKVSFYYVIGLLYWEKGQKEASRPYFTKGFELAKQYPGTTPAMDSNVRNEIYDYFQFK